MKYAGNEDVEVYGELYDSSGTFYDTIPNPDGGCDIAVVIEVLQFAKTPDETESATICDNEFYEFEGMIYEEEGSYPVTVQDGNGCDYVRTLILGVSPNPTIENDYLICPGDSIVVHDMVYYEGGNYIDTIENEPLCDSIIFTNITVLSGDQLSIDTTICVGDTIFGYYEEGIYEFVIDQGECFTEITLTLSVEDYPMAFFEFDLCTGDEIEFLGQVYDQGGIFQYSVETDFICDSVYIIEIIEFPVDTVNLDISICSNEDFMGYTESGTYLYSVDEGGECPTQYILELTVDDLINLALSDIICEGDSIEVRGNYYSEEGTYYDTLASATSCDTLLTFQLAIYEPTAEVFEEATICANQTYEFYGQQFDEAGSYELEVIDENGCVFIANLTLGVDDLNALVFNESICWNETVVIRGVEYSEDYEGEEIVESLDGGCDTIISITVTQFIKTDDEIEEANICANDDYTFEGTTYQEAGIYEVEKEDVNGCSYTRTLILGVDPNPFREETILICEGESYEIGDSTYIESGIYSTFLGNDLGCDSLISTDLTVIESTSITIDSTICQGASVYGYTESGSYDFTIDNGECQQEISLELLVETIPRIDYEEVICIGDSVEILGQFYYADYYEEQAIAGEICDTILTISVTQIGQITSIDTVLCAGEDIYNQTETGDYEIVDSLAGGCFDLIYLSLVIEDSPVVMQVDTICQGDSILWDGAYIYEAGTYSYVVEVDGSCDTMRVLELTDIEDLPSVLDTTICAGDTFQGVGETDTFNYLIEYGNCDKEITVFLEVLPPLSSEMAASICDGDTLFVGADQLTMTGVYETVLVSDAGCDSLVKTFLAVLPRDTLAESVTICEGEEYNGYSMTGQYSYFQEGSGLCDDLVNLTLEVNQVSSGSDVLFVCPGDSVLINGEYETEAGFFIDSLIGENGCDSLLFIELIDVETSAVFIDTTICFGEDYEGFTVSGTYQYEIQISDDCIVNIELELTVEDEIGSYQYIEICEGDSVVINGNVYTEELEVIENYDIDGLCDSTVVYDINFAEILTVSLDTIICDGEEVYGFMESGIYEVEVQAQNCLLLVSLELLVVDTVFVESGTFVQSSCGSASGSVDVEFNVDFEGVVYSIDEGLTYQDTSFYDGLAAGDYEMVIIFPGFPCLAEIYYPFTIGATSDLVVDTLVFNTVLCDMEQGVVELEAVTGQGPYDYVWSDGVQDSIRTDLGVGEYSVEITDAAGCSASLSFEVVQGEEIDIDFQGQNSYEICFGDSILLAANNPNVRVYLVLR